MTTFSAPFKIKLENSDTTALVIQAAGTVLQSNPVTFVQQIECSATATFHKAPKGPGGIGTVEFIQRATILQNNTAGNPITLDLPIFSNVIDFWVDIETPFGTAAGVTACNIEASLAAAGSALALISTNTSGRFNLMEDGTHLNMAAFRNITKDIEVHVSIVGSNTAITTGQGVVGVRYITR